MSNRMMVHFGTGAGVAFPDFDKILDFTSAGSESSTSVSVNGDTDLEYKVIYRNLSADYFWIRLNNDSTAGAYGYQYILNNAGTITAARGTYAALGVVPATGYYEQTIFTPSGFIDTTFNSRFYSSSGTTVGFFLLQGYSYNSTSNVTSINFIMNSGNFTAGTRILVYRRRVNT